jgi:single-strand DNA-binding protein
MIKNQVQLIGNLGKDPEVKYTDSGKCICKFSLAVKGFKEDQTDWFDVTFFDKKAEVAGKYLKKGHKVIIQGYIRIEKWEKDGKPNTKWSIVGQELEFLTSKKEADASAEGPDVKENPENEEDPPF